MKCSIINQNYFRVCRHAFSGC